MMQGYDFYWLYKNKNCKLQMGGSDQWGNMTTGTELIRRKTGGEAFVFTNHLITKSDGSKFGKSESGNIWLDANKTSPYLFYQFWLNAADADAEKWIKIFTFLTKEEVEELIEQHRADASKRLLQKRLAQEITVYVHGIDAYDQAIETTEKLFSKQEMPIEEMSAEDLEGMQGIVKINTQRENLELGIDAVSFLAETGIFPSKGEARKMVQNGGVSINRKKVDSLQFTVNSTLLLHGRYLLIQKGKKNFYLVHAQ
jgi:tyrosyl-tRNA synthetase